MVEKIPSPLTGAICNERTGWLPFGFDAQVRQYVTNSIKELMRNYYKKDNTNPEAVSEMNQYFYVAVNYSIGIIKNVKHRIFMMAIILSLLLQ